MDKDVLASFDGFLEEVRLVETNKNSKCAGVCNFSVCSTPDSDSASIEFIRSQCLPLSQKALIGVFAHEFGHLEDRFFEGNCAEVYNENAELNANNIACDWGFREEIFQMYKELGYSDEEFEFDVSEIDEESVRDYWRTRSYRVQIRRS
jgi:hypothetical protein